ncbi:hypothetical protein [Arthrobacter sp. SD76]|uniref:hypothetical protein n=1 Tax=Arthrobacter sp. SD76 TaxID=3415007 RepID=UPI003C7389AA
MPLQDQPRIRKAFIAGAVAVALSGTGAAIAWSADSPLPAPSPSQSAPGQSAPGQEKKQGKPDKSAKPGKPGKPDKSQRPQLQHSESVVKNADGTFQTIVEQRGTVEAVSETSITVKSEDGFSRSYAVNAETRITKAPATGEDGKLVRPGDGSIADISPGEAVRISGVKSGDQATAGRIAEGAGDVPGLGLGRGSGMGHGHARGQSQ